MPHELLVDAAGVDNAGAVNIALIGASGRIGRRVLDLIAAPTRRLRGTGPRLCVAAVANSRTWMPVPASLPPSLLLDRLASAPTPRQPLAEAVTSLPRPLVVVDCSASEEVAARYPHWLHAGIDVVTPNKFGPSADAPLVRAIAAAQAASGATLRDSATVGAQLPLLTTLRELHQAGDRVERIEAVLSGTLSFVLGRVQQGAPLSAAVHDAIALGFAEPHPARDLSGEDAARKLVILLRALGHDLQLADVERVPLIDAALLGSADATGLLGDLQTVDGIWRARAAIADARRERWIYRASFSDGHARVAPERVAQDHPLARLAPCENALILHSAYYSAAPLVIAGPGAGIELTAAAVFGDLLAAARYAGGAAAAIPAPRARIEAVA